MVTSAIGGLVGLSSLALRRQRALRTEVPAGRAVRLQATSARRGRARCRGCGGSAPGSSACAGCQPLPGETQFAQTMPEPGRQRRHMGAAPNPRFLTGWFGASSRGLRFPVRAFLRFPVCPPGPFPVLRRAPVSLRPADSGSVPSAVAVRSGSPPVSLRVPFPSSNPHLSAAASRSCGRWSRAAGTKVTSSRRDPWLGSPGPPATRMFPGSGPGRAARQAGHITAYT
jgi:hypothetical protein